VLRHCRDDSSWAVRGDAFEKLELLQQAEGLGEAWRESLPNVCVDTDRCPVWSVSCNADVEHLFASPWHTYGFFLEYLFSRPKLEVRTRVEAALTDDVACALGVHLRKEHEPEKWNRLNPNMTRFDVVKAFRDATKGKKKTKKKTWAAYVAADEHSAATKELILRDLREAKIPVIEPISTEASRMTFSGMFDAVAENSLLATCSDILPKGVGYSTFHDVAVAHTAFLHDWPLARIRDFVHFSTKYPSGFLDPSHMKHATVPADCADLPRISAIHRHPELYQVPPSELYRFLSDSDSDASSSTQ